MALKQTIAPSIEPVTLTEAKLHLRVDTTTEDTLITTLISTARQYCEGYQRRAYITQTWELWLDSFPADDRIDMPLPPLQSITSIKYYDIADVEHTMPAADYFADVKSQPGRVSLVYNKTWPAEALRPANGVCITFMVGYGLTAASVPEKAKQSILLLVAHYFENRESVSAGQLYEAPQAVDALLWLDRCF